MKFKTLKFELRKNGIGVLSLNRPQKLNTITFQMEEELHKLLDHLMINLNCRVLILRAEGDVFCAGTDLQEGLILNSKKTPEGYENFYHLNVTEPIKKKLYHQWRISELIPKLRKISQPIISIIQGAAAGGGLGLIMASDIRLASEEAKFINASINIGLTGGDMGSSYFLPRLIGMSRAAELLYTGKVMDAKTAEKVGFISRLVKKEELLDKALELANEMLKKSPLGLRLTKKSINLSLDSPSLNNIIQFENNSIVLAFSSKDISEASSAFFAKKDPKYPLK